MTSRFGVTYRDRIVAILDGILATESRGAGRRTGRRSPTPWSRDRLIHVAGSGHSHLLAEEVFYRAGGIAAAQAILDEDLMLHKGAERSTDLEREKGTRARGACGAIAIAAGDVVFIASNSGRNAYPIELAHAGAGRGGHDHRAHLAGPRAARSTRGILGQAAVRDHRHRARQWRGLWRRRRSTCRGQADTMGPTSSTIAGVFLLNTDPCRGRGRAGGRGIEVDVYRSANADNAEAHGR